MTATSLKILVLSLFLLTPVIVLPNYDILDNIANGIRQGNSKEISKYFDDNVEITILDKASSYSKVQAEMVLRDFFSKNPVKSFEIVHRGTSGEGSFYGIGTLKTDNRELGLLQLCS